MDPAAEHASGGTQRYDADGAMAASGQVSEQLLRRLQADSYYRLRPPRSTGRERFNAGYLRQMLAGLDPAPAGADVVATVTRLLVDLLAGASREHDLGELVLSGGGCRNATTVRWLRSELPGVAVLTTDELGVPVQAKEALAFAVLGYLTWNGRPGSVTAATGASASVDPRLDRARRRAAGAAPAAGLVAVAAAPGRRGLTCCVAPGGHAVRHNDVHGDEL